MRYCNDVTIFECALDQALSTLELADCENYTHLDDDYVVPSHD